MSSCSSRKSLFGGPSNFGGAQLPTYLQVGKQFLMTKIELETENRGKRIFDLGVAKKVIGIRKYNFNSFSDGQVSNAYIRI